MTNGYWSGRIVVSNQPMGSFEPQKGSQDMCKVYGYARISKQKQSIERQVRNISAAFPCAIIITEAYTGTKIDRKEWNKLVRIVKGGDTIVFDSVSRMSRNAAEGFVAYEELYNRGINLVFLKEPPF